MLSLWLCQLQLWKILKEMGVPFLVTLNKEYPITYLLKNLHMDQEPTEQDMDKLTGSKLGKEYEIAVDCDPVFLFVCLFFAAAFVVVVNLYADYIMWNAQLQELQAEIKTARSPNGKNWRGTREPPDEGERGQWKSDLKLNINKTKIMAYCVCRVWQSLAMLYFIPWRLYPKLVHF